MLQVPGQDQWLYISASNGVVRLDLRNADYNYIATSKGNGVWSMSSDWALDGELDTCACVLRFTVCALVPSPSMS